MKTNLRKCPSGNDALQYLLGTTTFLLENHLFYSKLHHFPYCATAKQTETKEHPWEELSVSIMTREV